MALDWFTYRLLVFMKNGISRKTEPWGTPFETFNKEEVEPATLFCLMDSWPIRVLCALILQ